MKNYSLLILSLLSASLFSQNLVTNGDFESGNTGFTTSYTLGPTKGAPGPGKYHITDTARWYQPNIHPWQSCTDHTHTTGSGKNMMVMDASATANQSVWCQSVSGIHPNTTYKFSTWVESVILIKEFGVASLPVLQFSINGELLGSLFSVTNDACEWAQFYETWNSGTSTSAQICIVNQNTYQQGNDLAIDDISLIEVGLSMPNVFTPNADGSNDTFYPITYAEIDSYSFIILDRWGRTVYEQKETPSTKQPEWNGKMDGTGADCSSGTYYWVLNYGLKTLSKDIESRTLTGYLTLIR